MKMNRVNQASFLLVLVAISCPGLLGLEFRECGSEGLDRTPYNLKLPACDSKTCSLELFRSYRGSFAFTAAATHDLFFYSMYINGKKDFITQKKVEWFTFPSINIVVYFRLYFGSEYIALETNMSRTIVVTIVGADSDSRNRSEACGKFDIILNTTMLNKGEEVGASCTSEGESCSFPDSVCLNASGANNNKNELLCACNEKAAVVENAVCKKKLNQECYNNEECMGALECLQDRCQCPEEDADCLRGAPWDDSGTNIAIVNVALLFCAYTFYWC